MAPFVALGIPLSEVGLLFGVFPVAVGGLVLFCGSVAGMTDEAGYAGDPWRVLVGLGVLCPVAGVLLATLAGHPTRGAATGVAGGLLAVGGVAGHPFEPTTPR